MRHWVLERRELKVSKTTNDWVAELLYSVRYFTGMCGHFIPAMHSMVSRWRYVPFTVASGADASTLEVQV
jgi:hypothetical protein